MTKEQGLARLIRRGKIKPKQIKDKKVLDKVLEEVEKQAENIERND